MKDILKWVFLVIFLVSTSIHLYASKKQNKKLRGITKPFILLALLGFYIFSVEKILWTVVAALICSWLGDVLLIIPGVKWFTLGGISFMISHGFFIWSYIYDINFVSVPLAPIIILALLFICIVTVIFKNLKPYLPKALFYPMYLYLLVNGAMNCFAIFRMISGQYLFNTVFTCIGAILFFISDASLFFVRFNKDSKQKTHFLVMLTYSLGEFLIVLGLL
ncbi:MAG: lysoplasmalogenase [Clostridiales bacterium]|nr:lysoplasmalogenase [Clostridiales bacterium]